MRWSSVTSEFITHRRRMSAPYSSVTFCGAITLPSDLLILRPCSSSVKPCVSTALNGARPRRADGLQQRGLEPAAMLVRALQIQVGRPGQAAIAPA